MATTKKTTTKPTRKKPTTRSPAVASIIPRPDPSRKAAYRALVATITKARRTEARDFDALYEAIGEVIAHELFLDGGYRSVHAFVAKVVKAPLRSSRRLAGDAARRDRASAGWWMTRIRRPRHTFEHMDR